MPSFHISLYLIDNIQYINSYRRSGRVIRDIKLRCHAIIAQIFTTHTSSRYRALTFLSFPPFSLSFFLSLSSYLPCKLTRRVATFDCSTNQRQISRRVRIIFISHVCGLTLDFYRYSVIVIGYWPLGETRVSVLVV